jgi:tetratricopeptide (TPR) repeat protein
MIRLNWKAVGILLVTLAALGAGTVALYRYQKNRTTAGFLATAKAAAAAGDREAAREAYLLYLQRRPADVEALRDLGRQLDALAATGQDNRVDVLECYNRLLDLRPDDREVRRHVIDVLVDRRPQDTVLDTYSQVSPDDATAIRRHVLVLNPEAPGTPPGEAAALLEARGLAEIRLNDRKAAPETFEKALERDGSRILAARILAGLLADPSAEGYTPDTAKKASGLMDAMVAANEAIKDNPRLAAAYLERGVFRRFTGATGWREDLDRALKLDPKGLAVLLQAGQFAAIDGKLDEARARLKQAIAADSKDPRAYRLLADIELQANRPEEAAAWLQEGKKAIGGARPDPNLNWSLTTVLAQTGKLSDARQELAEYRGLRLDYNSPEARLARAAETQFVEAIIALGEAKTPAENARAAALLTRINPESLARAGQNPLDSTYYLTLAAAYARSIDRSGPPEAAGEARNKAIAALRRAIALRPTSALPLLTLAGLLRSAPIDPKLDDPARAAAAAGQLRDAAEVLEAGLAQFPATPEDPATRDNLGRVLAGLIQIRLTEQAALPKKERSFAAVDRLIERGRNATPDSAAFNEVALGYYAATGRLEAASADLKARADKSTDPDLWAALARSLTLQGRPAEAVASLDEAAKKLGDRVPLRLARAAAEQARRNPEAALAALTAGIDALPTDERPGLWQQVARIQIARRDYDAAKVALDRWSTLRPRQVEPHAELFRIALGLQNEKDARTELAAIEERDGKGGFQTLCSRVDLALNFETPEQAEAAIKALEDAYPQRWETHLARGLFLEQKRADTDGAIKAYKRALEITPAPGIVARLAALYAKAGKVDELASLQREAGGSSAAVTQISVGALASAGRKDRAAELAADLAQGNPEALNVQLWQAEVLRNLGNPEEAAKKLKEIIKANPQQLDPWVSLLMLQVGQKQTDEAAATLEAMKPAVRVDYPEIVWARCALALGDRAAADRDFKAALGRWPADPLVVPTVVAYFRQAGRDPEAVAALREAHRLQPDARWATNQLAELLAGRAATWPEALALVEPPPPAGRETGLDRLVRANVYARGPGAAEKEKAIALLKDLADDPTNTRTTETRLLLAELYREQGKVLESLDQARLATANSNSLPALAFFIDRALENDRVADARQALSRLEAGEPDSLRTAVLRARVLLKEGKPTEGIAGLQQALASLSAGDPDATYLLAAPPLLFQLGDAAAGAQALAQVATLRPDLAWAMTPALVQAGRLDEAFGLAERTLGTEQAAGAVGLLVQSVFRQPLNEAIIARLDGLLAAALKPNPKLANLLIAQATIRHFQRRYDEEVAIYKAVLKDDPARSDFLNNLAWTLSESLDQPEEALTYVDKALEKTPGEPSIADTRGMILLRLKRYPEAIQVFTAAAQDARLTSPGVYPVILYHLARAYQADGKPLLAQQALDTAERVGFKKELLALEERADAEAFLNKAPRP